MSGNELNFITAYAGGLRTFLMTRAAGRHYNGAQEAARLYDLLACDCAVLKARSPMCGRDRIYDGTFSGTLMAGDGRLAALVERAASHGVASTSVIDAAAAAKDIALY